MDFEFKGKGFLYWNLNFVVDTYDIKLKDDQGEPNILAVIDAKGMLYIWKECNI